MDCYRYTISIHETREQAESAIEYMLSTFQIFDGEKPEIIRYSSLWHVTALQYSF